MVKPLPFDVTPGDADRSDQRPATAGRRRRRIRRSSGAQCISPRTAENGEKTRSLRRVQREEHSLSQNRKDARKAKSIQALSSGHFPHQMHSIAHLNTAVPCALFRSSRTLRGTRLVPFTVRVLVLFPVLREMQPLLFLDSRLFRHAVFPREASFFLGALPSLLLTPSCKTDYYPACSLGTAECSWWIFPRAGRASRRWTEK